ncbi:hypothetical protein FIBSPDRAFT_898924 [Athelia psychrophila]|uniref:Uncharacterized protein n=1 Tax=Athelia psychrophila TaxID=1759441 RepID=A0A166AG59_9AGAM|nr:hypothetical protein FIBSPDRAFT_898924 [Fibularhizoctonia sp. CBS 109695]
MLLSSLGLLLAARVALAAHIPQDNAGWATGPSSTNKSQIFQERLSNNDYVWFDSKDGGEGFYAIQRVGWRLKDDDGSTVIHTYNSSENIVTYEGTLQSTF